MPRESTILVVDDEPAILVTYQNDLAPALDEQIVHSSRAPAPAVDTSDRYRLLLAGSGEQAVEMVAREVAAGRRVCAGFFDMKLPGGIDGLETMVRVRKIDPDVLCCVVTAFQDRTLDDISRHFPGREDEWDYLTKPFSQLEIGQKARNLVSSWWRRREQERLTAELRALNATLEERVTAQVADIRQANEKLHEAARTDPQTSVGNRLRLREDLETLRARVLRYGHNYCAVLCDIDHFKRYNDHYGHVAGDEALLGVVNAIRSTVRAGDTVYRFGGEEFLVILPEQPLDRAKLAAERIRAAVESTRIAHAGLEPAGVLTISAGIASVPLEQSQPIAEWLRRADAALYEAKAAGRNRVVAWNPDSGPERASA